MKLRNKLIPLASIFATGAVLAPATLTACSNASGMVDLTSGNYATTIKKAKTEGYEATEDLAMELWMSSINENPEVFIQDRYWGDAAMIKGFADYASIDVTSIKGQCKDVTVKWVTVKDGAEYRKIPTISMTYTLVVESNWSVSGEGGRTEVPVEQYASYAAQLGCPLYYPMQKYYYDRGVAGKIYSSYAYESKWTNVPVVIFDFMETLKTNYWKLVYREAYQWAIEDGYDPDEAAEFAKEQADEAIEDDWPYIVKAIPKVASEITQWSMMPSITDLLFMDQSKLDWNYSVKYAKQDTFVFDKDGVETSKVNGSSLDRSYNSYEKLTSGPSVEESEYYTKASGLLASEMILSYYLSDITKVTE